MDAIELDHAWKPDMWKTAFESDKLIPYVMAKHNVTVQELLWHRGTPKVKAFLRDLEAVYAS